MFLIYIFQTKTKSDFGVSQNPICLRSETGSDESVFLLALAIYASSTRAESMREMAWMSSSGISRFSVKGSRTMP